MEKYSKNVRCSFNPTESPVKINSGCLRGQNQQEINKRASRTG